MGLQTKLGRQKRVTCLKVSRAAGDWLYVVGPIILTCEYRLACDWLWGVRWVCKSSRCMKGQGEWRRGTGRGWTKIWGRKEKRSEGERDSVCV